MAAGAAGYRQTFITFGLKEDFLEGLTAAIHAVQVVATARSGSQTSGVTATAGVKALLRRGHLALGVLHSLVKSDLSAASPLLAGWTEATRVRKPATARRAGTRIANIVVTARVASAEGERPKISRWRRSSVSLPRRYGPHHDCFQPDVRRA